MDDNPVDDGMVKDNWPWAKRGFAWWLEGLYIWLVPRLPRDLIDRCYMRVVTEADEYTSNAEVVHALELLEKWLRHNDAAVGPGSDGEA